MKVSFNEEIVGEGLQIWGETSHLSRRRKERRGVVIHIFFKEKKALSSPTAPSGPQILSKYGYARILSKC